ncbi:MAG TPA: TonB-dependent receptor [Sphingobium sp.]
MGYSKNRSIWMATGAMLSIVGAAAPAWAQQADEGLGDIVVTASRREESIQKAPVAVTALTADAISRLQITNAKDIAQVAPNVSMATTTGGSAGIVPFIRGGGVTDGSNITSEPEVGIYIDDVYQPRASASFIESLDLERIEVLRGPQGTLYGRNSSAGALKFITRAPAEQLSLKGEAGIGSWNEAYGKASVSGPLNSDGSLRAGFSGIFRNRDGGRQYNVTQNRKVGGEQFAGGQLELYYQKDAITARLRGYYSAYDSDGLYAVSLDPTYTGKDPIAVQPISGDYRKVLTPTPAYTKDRAFGASLNVSADLAQDWKLISVTGWSNLDDDWQVDFSGGVPNSSLGLPGGGVNAYFNRESKSSQSSFSQELQLHGAAFNGFLTFVSGLYFFHEEGNQNVFTDLFGFTSVRFGVKTDSYAAFGEAKLHLNDRIAVTLGGRYTQDNKKLDAIYAGAPVRRQDRFSDFLPKAGIDIQLTPQILAYGSYSEGFKAGGYNGLANSATELASPFAPQKVKAYEIGLKTEFLDHRARVNLSAFINDYSSIQQQSVTSTGAFITQNYKARHKGIEAELSFRPIRPLTLWTNAVYNDGAYTVAQSADVAGVSYVGNEMTNVFKYQITVGADVNLPLGPGKLIAGANYNARSHYYATPDNLYYGYVPATNLVNAYIGYDYERWSLKLSAKNLTDDRYWSTGFGFAFIAPRFLADPRTWRLSVGYKF